MNLERLNNLKKNTMEMNAIANTLLEKRNKEHHVNFGVCKAMNDENNG